MIRFVFWDVQHGNATYFSTPHGQHIAVDLGTGKLGDGNPAFSPLLHMRDSWGVSQLDSVILTHPHRDHLDDIFNFDKLYPRAGSVVLRIGSECCTVAAHRQCNGATPL